MAAFRNIRPRLAVVLAALLVAGATAGVGWLSAGGPSAPEAAPAPAAPAPAAERIRVGATAEALGQELEDGEDPEIVHLRARLAHDPDDVEALLAMGDLYVQRKAYSKARGYYLHAAQVAPANLAARTHLGTVAYFLGNVDEALHHYRQALALDPDYTVALFEMGAVLRYGKQDLAGAVETWEHFLRLDPDAPEAERIRKLVAETKAMIEGGAAPHPQAPPPQPDPHGAPWPGAAPGQTG